MNEFMPIVSVNEVAVLVTAVLATAVSSVWYSPLLFGKIWMRATGRTLEQEEHTIHLVRSSIFSVVCYYIFFYALGYVVHLAVALGYSFRSILFVLLIIVVTQSIVQYMREERSLTFLYVYMGYTTLIMYAGCAVLLFWPW